MIPSVHPDYSCDECSVSILVGWILSGKQWCRNHHQIHFLTRADPAASVFLAVKLMLPRIYCQKIVTAVIWCQSEVPEGFRQALLLVIWMKGECDAMFGIRDESTSCQPARLLPPLPFLPSAYLIPPPRPSFSVIIARVNQISSWSSAEPATW